MRVPFLDLRAQDATVGAAVRAAVAEVIATQQFVLGPVVARFEAVMAAYAGVRHAIGVGSGTDALLLALDALGAGPGRDVITTPFSFFATASTIVRLGARPVFVDIDPRTMTLDADAAGAVLSAARGRVAGILPVHLFGRLAPMAALRTIAARHGCWIVEDAAQAVGARQDGVAAGAFGAAGCLSFYPTKNLGAVGDGGMVLTDDETLAACIRRDRHQGQTEPYVHAALGLCSRLDALQAAALSAKLPHLDAWNARRRTVAGWYAAAFVEAGVAGSPEAPLVLPEPAGDAHVFHQFVVRARHRDALRAALARAGVESQIYYPLPLHLQDCYRSLGHQKGDFPESERAAEEVLSLPVYAELTDEQLAYVVEQIAAFYRSH